MDFNNPIQPTQLPRGYGGVAILWDKVVDKLIMVIRINHTLKQSYEQTFSISFFLVCADDIEMIFA